MEKSLVGAIILSMSMFVFAGGNPEHVKFPQDYQAEHTKYSTLNRSNGTQVAVLYANQKAIDSTSAASLADGSIIVMEIYKTKSDEDGKPISRADGVFEKGKFAAIAVMEKRSNWDAGFAAGQRSGDWGFAIYNTDGTVKTNDLDCASCHTPLPTQDYLFSHSSLLDFAK